MAHGKHTNILTTILWTHTFVCCIEMHLSGEAVNVLVFPLAANAHFDHFGSMLCVC